MARKPNRIRTVQVTLSTTQSIEKYLEALVLTGLYGKNPAEAAERLLVRAIDGLVQEGILERRRRRGR
jgi:hypothetical protein